MKPVFLSTQDAELLTQTFTIAEPESLPGIVGTVPDDWSKAIIEGFYDLRGQPRPAARCAHRGRHPHRLGYVCLIPGGPRFMVGKDCGATKHGADMRRMKNVFDNKRDRQYYLQRLVQARPLIPAAMNDLRLALRSEGLKAFNVARSNFRDFCGDEFFNLASIAQRGGSLTKLERVRDYDEEEKRAEKQEAAIALRRSGLIGLPPAKRQALEAALAFEKKGAEPVFMTVEVIAGPLRGEAFVAPRALPKVDLEEAQMHLREVFFALERSTDQFSTLQLKGLARNIRTALEKSTRALETLSSLHSFFDNGNLARVAASLRVDAQADRLVRSDDDQIAKPMDYNVPEKPGLSALGNAIGLALNGAY